MRLGLGLVWLVGCGSRTGVVERRGIEDDDVVDSSGDADTDVDTDGDADADADTESEPSGDFCGAVETALGDALIDCCEFREDEIWAHLDDVREECAAEWDNERIAVVPEARDACLSILTMSWGNCSHLYVPPDLVATHACFTARYGTQVASQPCRSDLECAPGLLCADTYAGRACWAPLELGATDCGEERFRCRADLYCAHEVDADVCRERLADGARCDDRSAGPCLADSYCNGSYCTPRLEDLAPCTEDFECRSDLCNTNGVCSSQGEGICVLGEDILPGSAG
jgi:hypothetical protein